MMVTLVIVIYIGPGTNYILLGSMHIHFTVVFVSSVHLSYFFF